MRIGGQIQPEEKKPKAKMCSGSLRISPSLRGQAFRERCIHAQVLGWIAVAQRGQHYGAVADIVIVNCADDIHGLAFSLLSLTGTCVAPLHPGRFDPP